MDKKLFDSELKIMELIWAHQPISAKELSVLADQDFSWNKNTTYTVIKKLEVKGYIKREDPGFICTALISKAEVRKAETAGLINKLFGGSRKALFSALVEDEQLTEDELSALRKLIDKE